MSVPYILNDDIVSISSRYFEMDIILNLWTLNRLD